MAKPSGNFPDSHRARDSWEDWEDEDMYTPIDDNVQLVPSVSELSSNPQSQTPPKQANRRSVRSSVRPLERLKSRRRQVYQNQQAGIKVITDINSLQNARQMNQQQHQQYQQHQFVDAAALRAIASSSAQTNIGTTSQTTDVSPNNGRIQIGIVMSPGSMDGREISPHTAVVGTPIEFPSTSAPAMPQYPPYQPYHPSQQPAKFHLPLSQQKSVWSPDTPDTVTPFEQTPVTFSPTQRNSMLSPQSAQSTQASTGQHYNPFFQSPSDAASCYPASIFDRYGGDSQTPITEDVVSPQNRQRSFVGVAPTFESKKANKENGNSPLIQLESQSESPFDDRNNARYWLSRLAESPVPAQMSVPASFPAPVQVSHVTAVPVVPVIHNEPFSPTESPQSSVSQVTIANTAPTLNPSNTTSDNWWEEQNAFEKHPQVQQSAPRAFIFTQNHTAQINSPQLSTSSARQSPRVFPSPGLASATMASSDRPIVKTNTSATVPTSQSPRSNEPSGDRAPPPYSPPQPKNNAIRYQAIFPPGHPMAPQRPPSPGPISPAFAVSMGARGGVSMSDIPLTPAAYGPSAGHGEFYHAPPDPMSLKKAAEKSRQRHEKEERAARRLGGCWRGRGCIPSTGCFGRKGREGRQRRRMWLLVIMIIIMAIVGAVVTGVLLSRRKPKHTVEQSIWVNVTGFPPMPTGVLTVVGPDNDVATNICTEPSTLWSCSLPKEEQREVSPFMGSQPTVTLNIQYDNGTDESWRTAWENSTVLRRDSSSSYFSPQPEPPSIDEMAFLGKYTDGVKSSDKAGEPTPFYISMLDMNDNATLPGTSENAGTIVISPRNITLPLPATSNDGSAANARLFPRLWQQPVRLFDRGLSTEHYGFYAYFRRTIYVQSINSSVTSASDQDGGAPISDADYLVTWAQTRVKVALWTNMDNSTALLSANAATTANKTAVGLQRPGTMPYPTSVQLDTHGGNPEDKVVWAWGVSDSNIDTSETYFIANDISKGGVVVNPRGSGNASMGGFDGGVGGCKCEWQNFLGKSFGS